MVARSAIEASAFVEHGRMSLQTCGDGPLADLTFAVKDLFDVAGVRSVWGNPDRLRAEPAVATAPSVAAVLAAGAALIGKTHTDEIACGMFGLNPHFGTPINPAAPDRVPGGSSSGSAAVVAGHICDFALGTDTGGSVRVPASFCGLCGIRTSFGRISLGGVMPMAPSFDTVGWLARDATTLRRVGQVYFAGSDLAPQPRFLVATDAFRIPVGPVGDVLLAVARRLDARETSLYREGVEHWLDTFRPLQLADLWATLGGWATAPGRTLSAAVRQRVALASTITAADVAPAMIRRDALARRLADLLGHDGILVMPTAHDLPPLRDASVEAQIAFRDKTLALTCVASLARLPQVNVPAALVEDCPVGLSLCAGPGRDEFLLAVAEQVAAMLAGR
jgi:amidase